MPSYIWMPATSLVALVATWRWWFRELLVPKTILRWLVATCYMVPVGVLFFIGIALDMGKVPSVGGIAAGCSFILGLWLITGLPMAVFRPLDAIESRKVRLAYAANHGLDFHEKMTAENLLPDIVGLFSRRLTNVLRIAPNAYIATTLRYLYDFSRDISICRGYDYLVMENLALSGTLIAVHEQKIHPSQLRDERIVNFQGHLFRITYATAIKSVTAKVGQSGGDNDRAAELLHWVLKGMDIHDRPHLKVLRRLYLSAGRITLEMDYLDRESKLDHWVGWTKKFLARNQNRF